MTLEEFIRDNEAKLGTAEQAIEFALTIDDHFDLRQFLDDWRTGIVATCDEYDDYQEWLREQRGESK